MLYLIYHGLEKQKRRSGGELALGWLAARRQAFAVLSSQSGAPAGRVASSPCSRRR